MANNCQWLGERLVCNGCKSASGTGVGGSVVANNLTWTTEVQGALSEVRGWYNAQRRCMHALSASYTNNEDGTARASVTRYQNGTRRSNNPVFGGAQMSITLVQCPLIQHPRYRQLLDPENTFTEHASEEGVIGAKLVQEFISINSAENPDRYSELQHILCQYDTTACGLNFGRPYDYAKRVMAGQNYFLQAQAVATITDSYYLGSETYLVKSEFEGAGFKTEIGEGVKNEFGASLFAGAFGWDWLYAGANINVDAGGNVTVARTYNGVSKDAGGCWDSFLYNSEE